jgi:lipid-binding SYLF domain-containing protein
MHTKITVLLILTVTIILPIIVCGCASPGGSTVTEKRESVQDMRSAALNQLYSSKPETRTEIAKAPGYAVFEAVQTQVLITSTGNAYGIVRDNQTGKDIYMSAFSAGGGFGAGIKSFRAIVIFNDREVMNEIINKGWVFGASGTADAKVEGEGVSTSGAAAFDSRMKIYTITEQGVMAGASLRGVRIWKNEELN